MAAKASVAKKTSKHSAPSRRTAPASGVSAATNTVTGKSRAGAPEVRLTHPDRVYWVDVGVTKQDLADYYGAVWDWMAPHVVGRPLALVRCPEAWGQCFVPEACLRGAEREDAAVIDEDGGSSGSRSRRAGVAGAGRRARDPRARRQARQPRGLRPDRVRSRSGRGRRLGRHGGGGARCAGAPGRARARKLREALGRQRPARGVAGRGRRLGQRQELRAGCAHHWRPTIPNATSPRSPSRCAREDFSSIICATRSSRPRSPPIRPARARACPVSVPVSWQELARTTSHQCCDARSLCNA